MTEHVEPNNGVTELSSFDSFEITLGDLMRGERATKGKTLEAAAHDLKMKAHQLGAIEDCDASAFPTASFVSGYIRSYAKYLSLDPQECFERFCEESGFDGVRIVLAQPTASKKKPAVPVSATKMAMMNDPLFNPRIPMVPKPAGFLGSISVSGIASTFVLLGLLFGIGFGGWSVLQEVQRVQFAPVNETPGVTTQVTAVTERQLSGPNVITNGAALAQTETVSLEQLYRPQELEIPKLVARDGPIGTIDPSITSSIVAVSAPQEPAFAPIVVAEGPPAIDILAVRPAWIRVFQKDGGVLFEKTLDAGQRYRVPADIALPMLRAGNSGSVYVMVGQDVFGPVGIKTGVARKVSLVPDDIKERFQAAELELAVELQEPVNLPVVAENTQE